MKHRAPTLLTVAILSLMVTGISFAALQKVTIPKSGVASLRTVLGGKNVQITFRIVTLRDSDPGFPSILKDGYNEASIVQDIRIVVDGKTVRVPWSAYADLFNLRGADLTFAEGVFELVTGGAHGADTYSLHLYFDGKRVIKRELYGAFPPYNKPAEVITYSPPIQM